LGKGVSLRYGQETIAGIFEDIGSGGELILRQSNNQRRAYAAGEVSIPK
jgi:biotin-(acetyl-CoA carboxylase) ligase